MMTKGVGSIVVLWQLFEKSPKITLCVIFGYKNTFWLGPYGPTLTFILEKITFTLGVSSDVHPYRNQQPFEGKNYPTILIKLQIHA